ncbi:helix-turn-helix transcriptional regulator [Leptospira ellisii]|uniref:Transcriptional regulator n=1 Tax=Leptospira ellisii TaxID=2023197 RepID=A0A2N0BHZ9_9LEPT|nr:helix-turn-helix transcriptional regulator [Leptospira ellisii]MDV6237604.1 helix-turn-helix transcriptional regulator [Leptospira ellisii]PJZ90888.1 transcriptional regulator [Leptospira ellisii]PKA03580.1 transcriptional regulator [Leptospira ellisii]
MVNKTKEPGERLIEIIDFLALNQEAFADSLRTTQQTVSRWCSGKVEISYIVALGIEAEHKINRKWLLDGKGEMFISVESQKIQISILNKATEFIRKINATKGLQSFIEIFTSLSSQDQAIIQNMAKSLKNKSK